MLNRDPERELAGARPSPSRSGADAFGPRLASFRRLYRWLNLTLVHQAIWPLLVILAGAPAVRPPAAPLPWYAAAVGAPALAALLALVYLAQRPTVTGSGPPTAVARSVESAAGPSTLRDQARLLLLGLVLALTIARLVVGPGAPTAKLLLFGLADVAAFQLIHFGVVARSFAAADQGQAAAVLLFGVSWGLREVFLAGIGVGADGVGLAFLGGLGAGVVVGLLSRGLRRWPGGFWSAAAGHFLVVYLIAGFVA